MFKTKFLLAGLPLALAVAAAAFAGTDWRADLADLAAAPDAARQAALVDRITASGATWQEISGAIRSLPAPPPPVTGALADCRHTCLDQVERPFLVYVPSSYGPARPAPLFVWLHGGVSRPQIASDREEYARRQSITATAEERGWLVAFPFGQQGATWWDETGMENVLGIVRQVKRDYLVDDDRVWVGGFSDGGSAAWLYAMLLPSDFAAALALNGHMGVGALDGGLHCYPPNLAALPVYAVNTGADLLYPTARMEPMVAMAQAAGAEVRFRSYPAIGHELAYANEEMPCIVRFLESHPRDPLPGRIAWEAAHPDAGLCRWLRIDRVATADAADWHRDFNHVAADEAVVVGFIQDASFAGPGMRVESLVEGDSLARRAGMASGDVLVGCGGQSIAEVADLNRCKQSLARGQDVSMTVERAGRRVELRGRLPDPVPYFLFPRQRPSARIEAVQRANLVEARASRVGRFSILVHPDLFRLDEPLRVVVDGRTLHDARVVPDVRFLLENWLEQRDRRLLYVARLTLEP